MDYGVRFGRGLGLVGRLTVEGVIPLLLVWRDKGRCDAMYAEFTVDEVTVAANPTGDGALKAVREARE